MSGWQVKLCDPLAIPLAMGSSHIMGRYTSVLLVFLILTSTSLILLFRDAKRNSKFYTLVLDNGVFEFKVQITGYLNSNFNLFSV